MRASGILGSLMLPLLAHGASVEPARSTPERGLHPGPLSVVLSSPTPGAWISWTTDGSAPPASGGQASPVTVNLARSAALRARAYRPGGGADPAPVATHTYVLASAPRRWSGTSLTDTAPYPATVWDSLQALPALCLALAPADFATVRDSGTGSIGSSGSNEAYERPCSAEWILPPHPRFAGLTGFQIDAGLRPHSWVTTKRAFRLYFKREYGAGSLDEPVFDTAPWRAAGAARSFEKIVLRAHSNDGWESNWGGDDDALYVRDQFASATLGDLGSPAARATWAHLFVNGGYYGLYSPTERPDHDFHAAYAGGHGDQYLGFNHGGVINEGASTAQRDLAWNPPDLSGAAAYTAFQDVLDVPQFIDFLLAAFYCNTHPWDWPVNGSSPQNFYGGNRNQPLHPVRHFLWDFEASLVWPAGVHPHFQNSSPNKTSVFLRTWFALRANADFRTALADRTFAALAPEGALHATRARERLDALARHVQPALTAEAWQWGDPYGTWANRLAAARTQIDSNAASLLASLRAEGLYPTLDPPTITHAAASVSRTRLRLAGPDTVNLANPNAGGSGEILYTLDGNDPRLPGGAVAGTALNAADAATLPVTPPARLRARVRNGAMWSALRDLQLEGPTFPDTLRISEIHYQPATQPQPGTLSVTAITGDVGGEDFGRARVTFSAAPPEALRPGDWVVLESTVLPANAGRHRIARREATAVLLDHGLTDEAGGAALARFEWEGGRYEFLELHNPGPGPLDLTGVRLLEGLEFAFPPGTTLAADAYAVLAPEPWDVEARYGPGLPLHRAYGRLDNAGEALTLVYDPGQDWSVLSLAPDTNGQTRITLAAPLPTEYTPGDWIALRAASNAVANTHFRLTGVAGTEISINGTLPSEGAGAQARPLRHITRVRYHSTPPWPVSAAGLGFSLVPSGEVEDPADPAAWRASAQPGGSPGAPDPSPAPRPALLVTEVLTRGDWPLTDAVEIHNPTAAPVDLAGWWLSDDPNQPRKFALPSRLLPPGGYTVFYEDNDDNPANNATLPPEFFGGAFALGADGDEIRLASPDTGYVHGFAFGAAAPGETFGRHVTSDGREVFPPQTSPTLGASNAGPRVGPVVITELHYHPAAGGAEFLEIQNISGQPVDLFAGDRPWEISGVSFTFPPGVTLAPGEVALVVHESVSPAAFAAAVGLPAGVRVWSCPGRLDNAGERVALRRPDPALGELAPLLFVDAVEYNDRAPWPESADGGGPSLERIDPHGFADDPANWRASAPEGGTPGLVLPPNTPLIGLAPAGFLLAAPAGDPIPDQALEIWNVGTSNLVYTLESTRAWLQVAPQGGNSAGPGIRTAHTLEINSAGLGAGVHVAELRVLAPGAANHPATVRVQLDLAPPDLTPPVILLARALDGARVQLLFSETVRAGTGPGGAEAVARYTLEGVGPPLLAGREADGRTVTLTFAQLPSGTTALAVSDVADLAGNPLAANTQVFVAYAPDPVAAGLAAHWRLDEGSGLVATDASGNQRHATLVNGAAFLATGRQGGAVELDGVNDRLEAGSWSISGSAITLAAWFRADDFGVSDARLIGKATGIQEADHWWMLSTIDSGGPRLRARLKTGSSTVTLIASSGLLTAGVWTHAALVYDGSALRLYQDGEEVGSLARTGALAVNDSVPVWLGDNPPSTSKPFDGALDDVRIYARALSPAEVAVLAGGVSADTDDDQDGLPDAWEITHFGAIDHPLAEPTEDADGDGAANGDEWHAGTHPRLAASVLRVERLQPVPGLGAVLRWPSSPGRTYRITGAPLPGPTGWQPLGNNLPATPPHNHWTNAPPPGITVLRVEVDGP
jgi:hypothetical protein